MKSSARCMGAAVHIHNSQESLHRGRSQGCFKYDTLTAQSQRLIGVPKSKQTHSYAAASATTVQTPMSRGRNAI